MMDDRGYILRVMDASGQSKYIPIAEFNIQHYECGLSAGDRIRLTVDLPILNAEGEATGRVHHAGELWEVLSGAEADPEVLWLRQPDGQLHGWDDDPSIFDTFERIREGDAV